MKLTFPERVILLGLLPQQSDFITLVRIDEARKSLAPTEQELKDLEVVQSEDGNLTWNVSKDTPKEIALGETVTDQIVRKLRDMNEQKTLEAKHISLWKKFVEPATGSSEEMDDAQVVTIVPIS